MPILKVFVGKEDGPAVLKQSTLIEPYDAFLLVRATPAAARGLARKYPVEDITGHYQIELPNRSIDTSRPRITTAGKVRHPAYRAERLSPGPHHNLVQFRGPIKDRWLAALKATGAKIREPRGSFAYVVWSRRASLPKTLPDREGQRARINWRRASARDIGAPALFQAGLQKLKAGLAYGLTDLGPDDRSGGWDVHVPF